MMLTPQPPIDMTVDVVAQMWMIGLMGTCSAIALAYSLIYWKRTGRAVLLLLVLSAGGIVVFEPMVDTVGACWFPADSIVAFRAWGRPIPVWTSLVYPFYFGIGVGSIWTAMQRGLTKRQVWGLAITMMIADTLFEMAMLRYDLYRYYGFQPLVLMKFPMWWAPVNGMIPVVTAAIIHHFDAHFRGWRSLLIVPTSLAASAATNATIGWPSWLVINTDWGWTTTQLGGLISYAFAFWGVSLVASMVAVKDKATRFSPETAISPARAA